MQVIRKTSSASRPHADTWANAENTLGQTTAHFTYARWT